MRLFGSQDKGFKQHVHQFLFKTISREKAEIIIMSKNCSI